MVVQLGYTALHIAAMEGNLYMMRTLVSQGANMETPDKVGQP